MLGWLQTWNSASHGIFTLPLLFFTFRCVLTFGTPVSLWCSPGTWCAGLGGWGIVRAAVLASNALPPSLPPSPPPAAAARACAVAHRRARESGATYCPPAHARTPLPAHIAGDCASDLLRFSSWGSGSGDDDLVSLHRWRLCKRLTIWGSYPLEYSYEYSWMAWITRVRYIQCHLKWQWIFKWIFK